MTNELLIIKKDKHARDIKFLVKDNIKNGYSPKKYENIMNNKDETHLANIFYDLNTMGYPIHKAYRKFRSYEKDPKSWFLGK